MSDIYHEIFSRAANIGECKRGVEHSLSQNKQKDTQTGLGCIKCSRCFIGVGFIIWHTCSTSCVFFFFLEFQLLQPSEIDPAWDRWPFTGLQHIHVHIPQPGWAIPASGLTQNWTQSGNRPKECGLLITTHHITTHCTTSYQHTRSDRNLKALVGGLCFLVKTQQKPFSAITVLVYPPEKPSKITETKQKKERLISFAFSYLTNTVSPELLFNMCFYCFFKFSIELYRFPRAHRKTELYSPTFRGGGVL